VPVSRYNKSFGGKRGSAAEALAAMRSQYGAKKGTSVFYATINKRKKRKGHVSSETRRAALERMRRSKTAR
jgi:hypothetical protein